MASRVLILRTACDLITDPEKKGQYDELLEADNGERIEIPRKELPGALALLQEAGDAEAVVEIAEAALSQAENSECQADIALSLALAHCDLGREAMAATPPRITEGCDSLDCALHVLRHNGSPNPELELIIDRTLAEMAPACVFELLALPDSTSNKQLREQALNGLKDMLWVPIDPRDEAARADRKALLVQASRHLTCHEQVSLYTEAPQFTTDPEELYEVALALVAAGFVSREPALVKVTSLASPSPRQLRCDRGAGPAVEDCLS
ncbi:arc6-like protein [Cymbomonas tetramitiformis]|uniref:Arc6-like protein n=1 Tax=Cymbomonas tetramitiformis TaxID=36881 RepID=A0AAE0GAA8_9CHLO|nr:arc6-like protein [Cymbomonas tetramitiformis]